MQQSSSRAAAPAPVCSILPSPQRALAVVTGPTDRMPQKLSSWQQQSQTQQALDHGNLTCCWVSCSIAGGGGLNGACGLRCSLAPGLRALGLALGRGPSTTASGRCGLGRVGCLWALGALHLLSAASCRGSHLQEQASSRVSHRRSESCCAIWNRQAGGLQQSTGSAAATCRTEKHSAGLIWCRLLQPLAKSGRHSDWLRQKI